MKKYQICWFWNFKLRFQRMPEDSAWSYIYEWILTVGFLEIRKWSNKPLKKDFRVINLFRKSKQDKF